MRVKGFDAQKSSESLSNRGHYRQTWRAMAGTVSKAND